MTELLKKAFDAVSALPPERQNALAEMILAEIKDENGGMKPLQNLKISLPPWRMKPCPSIEPARLDPWTKCCDQQSFQ